VLVVLYVPVQIKVPRGVDRCNNQRQTRILLERLFRVTDEGHVGEQGLHLKELNLRKYCRGVSGDIVIWWIYIRIENE